MFRQPGGKRDPGDADELPTLARELREELGCERVSTSARLLCHAAMAANEPGHRVETAVYEVSVCGEPVAQAEIAELRREHILPLLAQGGLHPAWTSRRRSGGLKPTLRYAGTVRPQAWPAAAPPSLRA